MRRPTPRLPCVLVTARTRTRNVFRFRVPRIAGVSRHAAWMQLANVTEFVRIPRRSASLCKLAVPFSAVATRPLTVVTLMPRACAAARVQIQTRNAWRIPLQASADVKSPVALRESVCAEDSVPTRRISVSSSPMIAAANAAGLQSRAGRMQRASARATVRTICRACKAARMGASADSIQQFTLPIFLSLQAVPLIANAIGVFYTKACLYLCKSLI